MRPRLDPRQVGWPLGRGWRPFTGRLWVPWDRTTGVLGPQGSGKTLDLLVPALLAAPGGALVTLTKVDDLLLTITHRSTDGRPCVVFDPFGAAPGLPELVWDPVAGCADPWVAERRARAFTSGTLQTGTTATGDGGDAARFYAAEATKIIQGYLHAAALTDATLDDVLGWVADPLNAVDPGEILLTHPDAAPYWAGLLHGALHGDTRTAGNTITTVQQALGLFFQTDLRSRCTPGLGRPATDLDDIIGRGGTVYLLGRDDPYAPASPLLTALAEHILDRCLTLARHSPYGRLCPPFLACLDELPSTAPLPTLPTRMANERALGISFIWAAQTWRQLTTRLGEPDARTLLALSNVLVMFGGSNDHAFNQEISNLTGRTRVPRSSWQTGGRGGRTVAAEDIPVLTAEEIRRLPERHALVLADRGKPLLATLHRSIDGRAGGRLLAEQRHARRRLSTPEPDAARR